MKRYDHATNLAHFLLAKTDSVLGVWSGRMTAKDQRALFGRFLGKGLLTIDGTRETIQHTIKIAFGLDYETTETRWLML